MKNLEDYRNEIDVIDDQIVDLLVERFKIVRQVRDLKHRDNIAIVQPARMDVVKNRVAERAQGKGLDGAFLRAIYTLVIDHAHSLEQEK